MSRCFPYPPPGYNKLDRSGSNDALIESIKLQRKREQAKAERKKEKKREKKEKRKDKKEKAKHSHFSHDQKIDKVEKSWIGSKDGFLHLVKDNEQLERSSLTEEHEQPIRSQNPSSSSDSTQNSNKRKRHTSPPATVKEEGSITRGHGNIIRIRLSYQKEGVDTSVGREEPCSTCRRTDLPAQQNHQIAPRAVEENLFPTPHGASDVNPLVPHRLDGEQNCSTSGKSVAVISEKASTFGCKRLEKKLQTVGLQFEDLIENWVPPPLQTKLDFDDQDWLLVERSPENQIEKEFKARNDRSCCSNCVLWPCVQFLPEVDIYSLPFTVPF